VRRRVVKEWAAGRHVVGADAQLRFGTERRTVSARRSVAGRCAPDLSIGAGHVAIGLDVLEARSVPPSTAVWELS
jgi:hypothetical protein